MEKQTIILSFLQQYIDVLYYVISLANVYEINLEECFELKDKLNKVKWNR